MRVLDSSSIMKKVYTKTNQTSNVVNLLRQSLAERTEVCSLKNAIDVNINGRFFCLANIGQRKHKDAHRSCQNLNSTLPLPKSIKENYHFIESFKRLGIEEKMNDFSTKIVLDVRRLQNTGKDS